MLTFFRFFIMFIVYSFAGYIIEMICVAIKTKKFKNRGFLIGPIIPIFGFGVISLVLILNRYVDDPLVVFAFSILITGGIEYFTSYLLEKLFHNKWWDYSNQLFNINGRVNTFYLLLFGIGGLIVVCWFHPFLNNLVMGFSNSFVYIVGIILLVIFVIDFIYSCLVAYELRYSIIVVEELKNNKLKMLPKVIEEQFNKSRNKIRLATERYLKTFPNLIENESVKTLSNWIEKVKNDNKKRKKSKKAKKS